MKSLLDIAFTAPSPCPIPFTWFFSRIVRTKRYDTAIHATAGCEQIDVATIQRIYLAEQQTDITDAWLSSFYLIDSSSTQRNSVQRYNHDRTLLAPQHWHYATEHQFVEECIGDQGFCDLNRRVAQTLTHPL